MPPVVSKPSRDDSRLFQTRWEEEYFFVASPDGKPVCLICGTQVCSYKEYNIKRHFEARHKVDVDKRDAPTRVHYLASLKQARREKEPPASACPVETNGTVVS